MKTTKGHAAARKEDQIALLNRLVSACEEDAKRFDRASREVSNEELALLFSRYSRRRAEFARELSMHCDRLQGKPISVGSLMRAHRRSALKPLVERRDDGSILSDCEHAEKALYALYEEAMKSALPGELQMSLRRQSMAVCDVHVQMRDLCAALAWCAVPMAV